MLATRTYTLRSVAGGTIRVRRALNHGRAMTLCETPNNGTHPRSMATAMGMLDVAPVSIPRTIPAFGDEVDQDHEHDC